MNESPSTYLHLGPIRSALSSDALVLWSVWFVVQALLYTFVPGPIDEGRPTPAGITLKYVVNGWKCWVRHEKEMERAGETMAALSHTVLISLHHRSV